MENRLFVFSPCGTSLLTNQADQEERALVTKYANTKHIEEIPPEDSLKLQSLAKKVEEKLASADLELAGKMSAELNGIIKLYNGKLEKKEDIHYLLCTDTWLGEQTATLVKQWLEEKGLKNVWKIRQKDLQTKDIESFQVALSDIVEFFENTIPGYRASQYKIIFNLTGGFKSVQGFLQTLATFYADETIYIFETAKDLLRIPRLPVKMVAEDSVRDHLKVFRRLANGMKTAEVSGVPETLLRIGDEVSLSPWGGLVWQRTKKEIYRERLHPSPSEKVSYGPKFENSLRGISADRLILINERIDQLAKNLESGGEYNVSSLDLKALKGNPRLPSTHEIDAWSDQDAKRIFGHFESGNHFVLDKLDSALHV
ncbi:putative CRISPR-associated protein [Cylindrospermopsis raciborskii G7]|uniref:putative CRISPR-associated protein n=1 Tax=Cylindrospermopsis raciborskii TaxID=77022 RepID=UPI003EBEE660